MGWQTFEALVMGVATIFHEQESYHYHPRFLWKINKFVHFFCQLGYVCKCNSYY